MSTSKVQLNVGDANRTGTRTADIYKGTATDASLFTEMKRRRLQAIGPWNGNRPRADYPQQRGFTSGPVVPRFNLRGAFKNYISS